MTAIDLLNALKAYMEDKVKDMRLIARVPEDGTDPGERQPLVFIGNLPNKEQEKKVAPYILLKLLTKKVDDEENVCRVRVICVTFSEDKNENYMQCLNLVTKIETSLGVGKVPIKTEKQRRNHGRIYFSRGCGLCSRNYGYCIRVRRI